jgi:hypothetical protein
MLDRIERDRGTRDLACMDIRIDEVGGLFVSGSRALI